jgi:hypothetical protein
MRTDRELLTLAAKAAGIEITWENSRSYPERIVPFRGLANYEPWNPKDDDGDALRLAATLGFSIHVLGFRISVSQYRGIGYLGGWVDRTVDDAAGYRLAILRGAAQLGEAA